MLWDDFHFCIMQSRIGCLSDIKSVLCVELFFLPQLVIENAREKILSNKSLQEKLAENINKILSSDGNVAQAPKQTDSGPTEQETSIDEILGLQVGDNSREPLSCKGFQLGEASCALKTSINDDDMAKKNTANEQLDGNCRPSKQPEVLKTVTPEHIGELEIAFDSVPCLTEPNKRQSSDSECNEHCGDSYDKKGSSALVSESERAMEIEKGPLSHGAQSSPNLEYVHSDSPQISLISLAECTTASENKTHSGSKCHLSPDTSLSEKTLGKSPSDRSPGHSVLLGKNSASVSSPSADAGQEQAVTNDTAALPGILQENSSHLPNHQGQSVQSDCAASSAAKISDLDKTELQLEVVDTSNKPYSSDQHTLDKTCKKDFNLPTELSNSEGTQGEMQEPSSSTKVDADNMYFSSGGDACTEISVVSTANNLTTSEICHSPLPETASSTDESGTEAKSISGVSSSSQPMDVDPSNIMSLKIIISDDPFISSDTELNNAVSSITGSAIIIASPVQPVLQGMVGMIPLSVVGQNGNTFSAPARQVLHMPVANPVCNRSVPKLPIPPKSQKIPGARSKANTDKLITAELGRNVEENLPVAPVESTSSNSRPSESHRRVLCFDNVLPAPGGNTQTQATKSLSQKERNENTLFAVDSASSSGKAQVAKREKDKTLPRILCKPEVGSNRSASAKEPQPERKAATAGLPSDPFHKTTANKENELRRDTDEKQKNQDTAKLSNGQQSVSLWNEKAVASVQELNKKQGSLSNGNSKSSAAVSLSSKEPKREPAKVSSQGLCLSSPFTKQCVEMLQDMQWHSPTGKTVENGELPVPRTPSGVGDRHTDDTTDSVRTPTCRRFNEDSTTPRIMVPPATPDLPACSPASETGSENSVSMAAHTLMILSRAAIARTSTATPLKDNTQQFRSLRSTVKKRKLEDLSEEKEAAEFFPSGNGCGQVLAVFALRRMKKRKRS
ncbi:protein hypothetical protein [Limosa lapponica baueri]|uniref:Protein NPAT C-terminal domain-containing protein n=1 Tax=Limosa lapponica baueri TaxID=1758121 RepID=A0A2I0TU31_LIMLA|nr:protein hypothetical protein [Limosa lapponica baueri]